MDVPCDTGQGGDVAGGKGTLADSAQPAMATAWQATLEKATKAVCVLKMTGTRCFDTETAGSSYATGACVADGACHSVTDLRGRRQASWWTSAAACC